MKKIYALLLCCLCPLCAYTQNTRLSIGNFSFSLSPKILEDGSIIDIGYVAIDQGTATIGDLSAGYYTTLTASAYASSSASSAALLYSSYLSKAFKFAISENCPVGTDIPFTVTFTDSWGNAWTDALTVPVVGTGASVGINTPVADNFKISEAANGDGKANPRETHYLDIRIKNGGTSKVLGLQVALSTASRYVTIDQGTAEIGDLSAGYYTTLTYSAYPSLTPLVLGCLCS
ncbi:MAG: hypothetical protein LBF75_07195 [Treponema sp.]|nr:hypothetical protein [Treponema sp.]